MTSVNPRRHGSVMPFKRYIDATHAARDAYLATTYHAHRQYLTGPWPDREAYQTVENTAWKVYYQASREAWQRYTRELGCPCCTADSDDCNCTQDCGSSRCQMANPPTVIDPRPAPQKPIPPRSTGDTWWPNQPSYTPNQEGTELWRSN